jgi:SAM-dependent methyltransferase
MSESSSVELLLARWGNRLRELIEEMESRQGQTAEALTALREMLNEQREALGVIHEELAKAAAERAELREAIRQMRGTTGQQTRDLRTYISRRFRALHYTHAQVDRCPNCAGTRRRRIGLLNDTVGAPAEVLQCEDCGLGYVSILLHPDDLARYYADGYDVVPSKEFANARAISQRDLLCELLEPEQRRRVFEIGAGTGALLKLLSEDGAEVAGVEPRWAVEDLNVVKGEAEDIAAGGEYDIVVLSHVLEHFAAPHDLLAIARRLLRPGGHLFLEIPNFESADIKADEYGKAENPHVLFLTAAALKDTLLRAGFSVVALRRSTPSGRPPRAENIVYVDGPSDAAWHIRVLAQMQEAAAESS